MTTNFPKFNPHFNLMIINFGFVVNVKSFLMRVLGGTNINFLVWLLDGIRPRLIVSAGLNLASQFLRSLPGSHRCSIAHHGLSLAGSHSIAHHNTIIKYCDLKPIKLISPLLCPVSVVMLYHHVSSPYRINHESNCGLDIFIFHL